MHRRSFLTSLVGLAAVGGSSGCADPTSSTPAAGAPSPASADAAFPADVTHRYGTTTVAQPAERLVTLGQTDHDAVIALGSTPVAVAGFVGGSYSPLRPWNEHAFTTAPPVLNMQEIEFENLAALGPDLILAVMSGVTKSDYAKLTSIAPTVAQPVDYQDWAVPLRPHTELIGAALGRPDAAAALVADLEGAFAAARDQNPALVGKSAACAELWDADFAVLGASAPRTQFLLDLGMTLPASLADLAGKEYNAPLSSERVDLLDSLDVVVWTTEQDATQNLLDNVLVRDLRTTKEGRYLLASNGGNDDLLYSMDWGSVLSHRWALENAVPRLLRAEDGDPATDPNT
ncbi:MAG TPA: ABC transporter substrate-binding protein [Microlunatus sp.]|nr:ABC transporter substrate-binding protein [Microlunatus sp.]